MLWTTNTLADLLVLYDSGQSWPIDRFLIPIVSVRTNKPATRPSLSDSPLGSADLKLLLPIRSPRLTPGHVATRVIDTPVPLAFFMIGSDDQSLCWLATHADDLKRLGAVGLLVAADNEADLHAVANAAKGLSITPASGEDIAVALAITRYPFAVTEGRIWQ